MRSLLSPVLASVIVTATTLLMAQEVPPPAPPMTEGAHGEARSTELLREFNSALEAVVSKVYPAVVQVQAAGLAPLEASSKAGSR